MALLKGAERLQCLPDFLHILRRLGVAKCPDSRVVDVGSNLADMLRPLALTLRVQVRLEVVVDALPVALVEAGLLLVVAVAEVMAVAGGGDWGVSAGVDMGGKRKGTAKVQRLVWGA